MRFRHPLWLWAALSAVVLSAGCAWGGSSDQVVSTQLTDDRAAYIHATYSGGARLMAVAAYAQVSEGTRGTLDVFQVAGPVSWHCPGTFRPWSPTGGLDLPPGVTKASDVTYLALEGMELRWPWPSLDFKVPQGVYTFTLTVEDPPGTVSVTVDNAWPSGAWETPYGCTSTGGPQRPPLPPRTPSPNRLP